MVAMIILGIIIIIIISCKKFLKTDKGARDGIERGKSIPDFWPDEGRGRTLLEMQGPEKEQ